MKRFIFGIIIVGGFLLSNSNEATAQTISGINPGYVGTTHTYTYTSSYFFYDFFWVVTKGTIVDEWQNGLTYYVTINWTSTGTANIKINEILDEHGGPFVTKSTRNITISTCTISAPSVTSGVRCGAGSVSLSATAGSGGSDLKWYDQSTGGSVVATGTSYAPNIAGTTTYYVVTYNPTTGCESSPRTAVTATINTVPSVPSPTNGGRCATGTVQLSASVGSGGDAVKWYTSGGTYITSGSSYQTPSISSTTDYQVSSYNSSTGCESSKVLITANVNSLPSPPTVANASRCGSGTVQLSASPGAGGSTINWYTTGGTYITSGPTYTTPSIDNTTSYHVTSNGSLPGCESSPRTTITATVTPLPTAPATSTDGNVISNSAAQVSISVSAVGGATAYAWYTQSTGGSPISGQTSTSYSPSISQNTTYYVESISGSCISAARKSVTASIHPEPVITANNNGVISMGNPVTLSVNNYSYDSYTWLDGNGNVISGAPTTSSYLIQSAGTYKVRVSKGGSSLFTLVIGKKVTVGLESMNMNYITTNTILVDNITNLSAVDYLPVESNSQSTQYFDGLGAPIQSVSTQSSPGKKDIVQPVVYDQLGREYRKYLPFAADQDGLFKNVTYDANGNYTGIAANFYSNNAAGKIAQDNRPFAETRFEPSPLNRVIKQGSPGTDWQPDTNNSYGSTDHSVKFGYEFNTTNEVLLWTYTYPTTTYPFGLVNASTGATPNYFAANLLHITKTKDEQGNEVIEYKDKAGKVLLKKVQASPTEWAQTYYIYDDFNNLVCVIPPQASKLIVQTSPVSEYFNKTDSEKDNFLKRWAFRYSYDERKRMSQKQVPGAEAVYMIYDKRDRLVLTQDGNQRGSTPKYWSFTKYDELNRPILTGIKDTTAALTQADMQAVVNAYYNKALSKFGESYVGNATGNVHGYSNKSYPIVTGPTATIDRDRYLSVTYYDNYLFKNIIYDSSSYSFKTTELPGEQKPAYFKRLTGQVTGTKTKVLDGGVAGGYTWLKSVNYYDDNYRVIQSVVDNYKGGTDRITNIFDFTGKVVKTKTLHTEGDVTWKDDVGVAQTGNKLIRTAETSPGVWGESGAVSRQVLPAGQNGWLEVTASETSSYRMIGFSDQNSDASYASLDYAWYMHPYGALYIYESGNEFSITDTYKEGDVLKIERTGTTIRYYLNGVLKRTSPVPSATSLMVDNSLYNKDATITGVRTSFTSSLSTVTRRFEYDHAGRLLKTWHQLDSQPEILLAKNEYNELGQLIDKKLHSTVASGANAKQSIDYRYNIRGWLTKMNESDLNGGDSGDARDFFGMQLGYNDDIGVSNTGLFNGNISAIKWSSNLALGSVKENATLYSYDPLNRIKTSTFKERAGSWSTPANNAFTETGFNYDLNGNITRLQRNDKRSSGWMDDLTYNYGTGSTQSNKLLRVLDAGDRYTGFIDGNAVDADEYKYDANGNLINDLNKGIGNALTDNVNVITYNYLNLPETVKKRGREVRYIYDATGRKLSQVATFGSQTKQTDYAGEYQYENDQLQFISHEEGRINVASQKQIFYHDGASANGFTASNATLTQVTQNGTSSYVKITSNGTTARTGVFPIGGTFSVGAGEVYKIRVKGYSTGANAASLLLKAGGNDLNWPGAALAVSVTTEMWVEQTITIPAGATTLEAGVVWATVTSGEIMYINDFEIIKLETTSPEYQYNLKDHLGNVRLTFTTKAEMEIAKATMEIANAAFEQSQFIYYNEAVKVNSLLFDHTHTTSAPVNTTLYNNNFSSNYAPFISDGTSSLSINSARLKVAGATTWNNAYFTVSTVAGNLYKISFDVDLASGGRVTAFAHDYSVAQNLALINADSNGSYSYQFVAMSTSTTLLFSNPMAGPRDYYLDNVVVENLGGSYSTRLKGGPNEKYGLAKSLSVMPGDTINIEVYAKYLDTNSSNWNTALSNFITSILNGTAAPGTFVDGGAAGSIGSQTFPYIGTLTRNNDNGTGPKGYLNYILFDRNFIYKTGGFQRISSTPKETGSDVAHERLAFDNLVITEPGYIYIYLSNENETPVEVYFDDFKVTHKKSPVIQTDDYYPFGLTFNSYSRENSTKNQYLYNNGAERQDELGLEIDLTKFRTYDPAIGRWWQIDPKADEAGQELWSPYNYSFNNPIRYNDPNGDCIPCWASAVSTALVALKAKYSSIAKPGQEAGQRIITNKSGNAPSQMDIDNTSRKIAKISGTAQDGNQVGTSARKLTKEVAKDGAKVTQETGDVLQKTGIGLSAVGLPEVGAPLIVIGSGLENVGVGVETAINVSEGNYVDAALNVGGLLLDNKASDQIQKVITKQEMNEQSRYILEANKEVVKEVGKKVADEVGKKKTKTN